jgi:hypothetical protein
MENFNQPDNSSPKKGRTDEELRNSIREKRKKGENNFDSEELRFLIENQKEDEKDDKPSYSGSY